MSNLKATNKLKYAFIATMALFTLNGVPEGKRSPEVVANVFTGFFNMDVDPEDGLKLVEELLQKQAEEQKELLKAMAELAAIMQTAGVDVPDGSAEDEDDIAIRARYPFESPGEYRMAIGINPNQAEKL